MIGAIVILGLMAVLAVFAALAVRFGVDSRIDSHGPAPAGRTRSASPDASGVRPGPRRAG